MILVNHAFLRASATCPAAPAVPLPFNTLTVSEAGLIVGVVVVAEGVAVSCAEFDDAVVGVEIVSVGTGFVGVT